MPSVLVVLFILTILGMLALSTAGVEVRLAANERDYQRALYAAEGGVAHARAILQAQLVANPANQARLASGLPPRWTFALTGIPLLGNVELARFRYTVNVSDNDDGDGTPAVDADGLVIVRADATGPTGTRASVEVMMSATGTADNLTGYGGQAGGGQAKNFTGNDTGAITDTTVNNLGGL